MAFLYVEFVPLQRGGKTVTTSKRLCPSNKHPFVILTTQSQITFSRLHYLFLMYVTFSVGLYNNPQFYILKLATKMRSILYNISNKIFIYLITRKNSKQSNFCNKIIYLINYLILIASYERFKNAFT